MSRLLWAAGLLGALSLLAPVAYSTGYADGLTWREPAEALCKEPRPQPRGPSVVPVGPAPILRQSATASITTP